jgi:hypothetical protein
MTNTNRPNWFSWRTLPRRYSCVCTSNRLSQLVAVGDALAFEHAAASGVANLFGHAQKVAQVRQQGGGFTGLCGVLLQEGLRLLGQPSGSAHDEFGLFDQTAIGVGQTVPVARPFAAADAADFCGPLLGLLQQMVVLPPAVGPHQRG